MKMQFNLTHLKQQERRNRGIEVRPAATATEVLLLLQQVLFYHIA